jgi:hypothetical protein
MSVRLVNINKFLADQHQREKLTALITRATEANWTTFYDGAPCVPELKEFAEEVQKLMPNVKLLPIDEAYVQVPVHDENGVYQTTKSLRVYNEFAVYLDEFPFDIGRISYKDNGARKKDITTYGVYSRKISNAKYAYHRDQHHMVTATDVKKALKNVSKYLMPYSTVELAQAFYEPIKDNVNQAILNMERELRSKIDPIVHDHHELIRELAHLKQQGVQFKSAKVKQVVENMGDVVERFDVENNRSIGAIFVRFYEVSGQTFFSTQQVIEVRKHHHSMQSSAEQRIEGKPVAEIPEDIMGAVSVLSILNNNQYVANVGMKLDDKHFWIERG